MVGQGLGGSASWSRLSKTVFPALKIRSVEEVYKSINYFEILLYFCWHFVQTKTSKCISTLHFGRTQGQYLNDMHSRYFNSNYQVFSCTFLLYKVSKWNMTLNNESWYINTASTNTSFVLTSLSSEMQPFLIGNTRWRSQSSFPVVSQNIP